MPSRDATRQRIVDATARLLSEEGRDAVTTRSVCAAAGVQPPTIYRLFGDMHGLLDAVTAAGFADYVTRKRAQQPSDDPIEDLRAGWDLHVAFGLENPAFYLLMYAQPGPRPGSQAAAEAQQILLQLVRRAAAAGRITVAVDRAAAMIHSAGMGVVFTLLGQPPEGRDLGLSAQMRETVLASIMSRADGDGPDDDRSGISRHAVALRETLEEIEGTLSAGEQALFAELLERLIVGRRAAAD